jgi:very-short-patch-repair endonuclease
VGSNKLLTAAVGVKALASDPSSMHSPETERARDLRNNMTKVEWFVWSRLRGRQVGGYKFRRQVPIGPYFADFACLSARLAIEIDGEAHGDERDHRRTAWLERAGYRVLRFAASDVDDSIEDVIEGIYLEVIKGHSDLPPGPSARPPRVAGR